MTTARPIWFTSTNSSVHLASVTALPRPWPRQSKRRVRFMPADLMYGSRVSACTAMPSVTPRPSSRTSAAGMVEVVRSCCG